MPTDLISATMQGSTLSNIQQLNVIFTFSNGQVTLGRGGVTGVYWGTPNTNDPRQWYTFGTNSVNFTGNMVNFYSEFWMNCDTNVLVGTIKVSQPLPVGVTIGSYGGRGSVTLAPGQTLLNFQLPVANYGSDNASNASPNELLNKPI